MSWLKDLAGQAEGLLNQLDQSAGEALSTSKSSLRSGLGHPQPPTASTPARGVPSETQSLSGGGNYSPPPTRRNYAASTASYQGRRETERDADAALIEDFLNKEAGAGPSRSQASHSRRSSVSSTRSSSIPAFVQAALGVAEEAKTPPPPEPSTDNPARKARLEREIIELKAREADTQKAMAAKDSQLAVLRVRLTESEALASRKAELLEQLKGEKDRVLRDSADSSQVRDAALGTLQSQLKEAEEELAREKSSTRRMESDYRSRVTELESQLSQLAHQLTQSSKERTEEKLRTSNASDELRLAKYNLEANKKEFDEYKSKAQRILAAKEKLIETLKSGESGGGGGGEEELRAEVEELRTERELAKEEASQAQLELYNLRTEAQELESSLAAESRASLEAQRELQEALHSAQTTAAHYQDQLHHLNNQHQVLQDELRRQQSSVTAKLQEKDAEIHRLQSQATSRSLLAASLQPSSEADAARIKGLTENLIQKQMTIEGLQTERNGLQLQLERMEGMYKEADAAAIRSSAVAINMGGGGAGAEGLRDRVPALLRETPYDSGLTRGVKKAYGGLHVLSLRGASFLRRYPAARSFLLLYIACLHLWVLLVLLTYSPEIHSTDYQSLPRPRD